MLSFALGSGSIQNETQPLPLTSSVQERWQILLSSHGLLVLRSKCSGNTECFSWLQKSFVDWLSGWFCLEKKCKEKSSHRRGDLVLKWFCNWERGTILGRGNSLRNSTETCQVLWCVRDKKSLVLSMIRAGKKWKGVLGVCIQNSWCAVCSTCFLQTFQLTNRIKEKVFVFQMESKTLYFQLFSKQAWSRRVLLWGV